MEKMDNKHKNPPSPSTLKYFRCMIAEQQIRIPAANINQKPFEERAPKKDQARDRRKSGEERKKTAADDIIARRVRPYSSYNSSLVFQKNFQYSLTWALWNNSPCNVFFLKAKTKFYQSSKRSVSPIIVSRTPDSAKKSSSRLLAKATPKPPKVVVTENKVQIIKDKPKKGPPTFDRVSCAKYWQDCDHFLPIKNQKLFITWSHSVHIYLNLKNLRTSIKDWKRNIPKRKPFWTIAKTMRKRRKRKRTKKCPKRMESVVKGYVINSKDLVPNLNLPMKLSKQLY